MVAFTPLPSSPTYSEASQIIPTINAALAEIAAGVSGKLFSAIADGATGAGTSEQVLQTYSLPANSFVTPGQVLRITASGKYAANTNVKTAKLYFGSEVIATAAAASNGTNWWLQLLVTCRSASVQAVNGWGHNAATVITTYNAAGAEAGTAAIVIKAAGIDGTDSAGDITCTQFVVEIVQ